MLIPRIFSLATANPPHRFSQSELLKLAGYEDTTRRAFFLNSEVYSRYLCINRETFTPTETVDELHSRYKKGSIETGLEAITKCLQKVAVSPREIDFIATTSCTGYLCPGLDSILVKELGMKSNIQRANLLGMGCSSAISALQQAYNYLVTHPGHIALVLSVEICSASYFMDDNMVTAVANALFGDGAAALLLTTAGAGIEILDFESLIKSEYLGLMGFENISGRLKIVLSKDIRHIGGDMFKEVIENLLHKHTLSKKDISFWVLHSGGRKVIEKAKNKMSLREEDVAPTRNVLRNFGNMSSATVLFVLDEVIRTKNPQPDNLGVMVSLGPGFAAESALLKW
ncbi:MAG: type III polyketide synthase [Candidatus Tectomicrobia bacterium]|uniref:Type III polyketide synthase n=1 Tax=Tectimicrobiota bacterium TaxID=2528274 RepID=A0A933GMV0_UNCTE|nr:type III polyketide synthase [Candidatus Tectomicrobia bacterium]